MSDNKMHKIKNRSASMVVYKIPDEGIRREFAPGETKLISYDELTKLMYQPGGKMIMSDFLQLDEEVVDDFGMEVQPEYYMSEQQVAELIQSGSMEAFLDCLDYAPTGIIDIVKRLAVSLPMNDLQKVKALKEKTGFDVEAALANVRAEKEIEEDPDSDEKPVKKETAPTGRRTAPNYKVTSESKATTPNYKVVSK